MSKKPAKVLIVEDSGLDLRNLYHVTVWADRGNAIAIEGVPGVYKVEAKDIRYSVYIDPRYDLQAVLAQIREALGG